MALGLGCSCSFGSCISSEDTGEDPSIQPDWPFYLLKYGNTEPGDIQAIATAPSPPGIYTYMTSTQPLPGNSQNDPTILKLKG